MRVQQRLRKELSQAELLFQIVHVHFLVQCGRVQVFEQLAYFQRAQLDRFVRGHVLRFETHVIDA